MPSLPLPASERRRFIQDTMEKSIQALHAKGNIYHIPRTSQLYRRIPRSQFHPMAELFIQTGGATDFECPDDHFRLQTNQICVMPRGVAHAETPIDLRTPYSVLVFTYSAKGVYALCGKATPERRIHSVFAELLESPRGRDAFHYLDEIALHRTIARAHRQRYVTGLLHAFFATLMGELEAPIRQGEEHSSKVIEVEKLVRSNVANPNLSVAKLAVSLNCSADYLSRLFRRERNVTLTRWIIDERMGLARQLLSDLHYNISEIGWACGFNSTSYFVRVFRETNKMTPRVWREAALRRRDRTLPTVRQPSRNRRAI